MATKSCTEWPYNISLNFQQPIHWLLLTFSSKNINGSKNRNDK